MDKLSDSQRLNLKKLVNENDGEETTELIRNAKHSNLIKEDVKLLNDLKVKYARLAKSNPNEFNLLCQSKCNFLYNNYTDIFNKVKKSEIDLQLLSKFLGILKEIEDGKIDQHDGSYQVGTILKQIYVDSALQKSEKIDKRNKKQVKKPSFAKQKNISWAEYKKKLEVEEKMKNKN